VRVLLVLQCTVDTNGELIVGMGREEGGKTINVTLTAQRHGKRNDDRRGTVGPRSCKASRRDALEVRCLVKGLTRNCCDDKLASW